MNSFDLILRLIFIYFKIVVEYTKCLVFDQISVKKLRTQKSEKINGTVGGDLVCSTLSMKDVSPRLTTDTSTTSTYASTTSTDASTTSTDDSTTTTTTKRRTDDRSGRDHRVWFLQKYFENRCTKGPPPLIIKPILVKTTSYWRHWLVFWPVGINLFKTYFCRNPIWSSNLDSR